MSVCCNCAFCNLIGLQYFCSGYKSQYRLATRPSRYAWVWLRQTSETADKLATCAFSNFHNATIVIQQLRMYLRYDVRIHTYIHTDIARVQHVNVGLAQARPNHLIYTYKRYKSSLFARTWPALRPLASYILAILKSRCDVTDNLRCHGCALRCQQTISQIEFLIFELSIS